MVDNRAFLHEESLRVDRICRKFDRLWGRGETPRIEDFLADSGEVDKTQLVRELIAVDWERRVLVGESPALQDYAERLPHLVEAITDIDPAELFDGSQSRAEPAVPHRIGDFQILRELGRGATGVVYEAVQESVSRRVALKVLEPSRGGSELQRARFAREARSIGRLHHSHIVDVYGTGEANGQQYMAIRLVEGCTLKQLTTALRQAASKDDSESGDRSGSSGYSISDAFAEMKCRPITPSQFDGLVTKLDTVSERTRFLARVGVQLADALEHAHSHGILHRDVKPSNILIDVQGDACLGDFGLASEIAGEEDDLTLTGEMIGTARYIAPESLNGCTDVRGDIYGLGLSLYELLVLRRAFEGVDRTQLLHHVAAGEIKAPRKLLPNLPVDLETIVQRCLAKNPGDRYQTAAEVSDEFRRYLAGEPIRARKLSVREQLQRWCNANPSLAIASFAILALLLCLVVGTLLTAIWMNRARVDAEQLRANEAVARQDHESELVRSLIRQARAVRLSNQPGCIEDARAAIAQASALPASADHLVDLRSEWVAVASTAGMKLDRIPSTSYLPEFWELSFDSDGRRLIGGAYFHSQILPSTTDDSGGSLKMPSQALVGEKPLLFHQRGHIPQATFLPDGSAITLMWSGPPALITFAGNDETTYQVRRLLDTGKDPLRKVAKAFSVASECNRIAISWAPEDGTESCVIDVYDYATQELLHSVTENWLDIHEPVGLSPDGRWLAWKKGPHHVSLVDLEATDSEAVYPSGGRCTRFSPDGKWLAFGGRGYLRIVSIPDRLIRHEIPAHRGVINDIVFSPNSRMAATVSDDATVALWDIATGRLISRSTPADFKHVTSVAFHPRKNRFAAAYRKIAWYSFTEPQFPGRLDVPWYPRSHTSIAINPVHGELIVAAPYQDDVLIRRGETWSRLSVRDPKTVVVGVDVDASGRYLTISTSSINSLVSKPTSVSVWNLRSLEEPPRTFDGLSCTTYRSAFSPDGRRLVARDFNGSVVVWDVASGEQLVALKLAQGGEPIAFSQDSKAVFLADSRVSKLDLERLEMVGQSEPFGATISDLQVSQSKDTILVCANDQVTTLRCDDLTKASPQFQGNGTHIAISDQGIHAVAKADRTVTLFEASGRELLRLPAFEGRVQDVTFSEDGQELFVYGDGRNIAVWNLPHLQAALAKFGVGW